jgi:nitrite reductase (NADH) large subunit
MRQKLVVIGNGMVGHRLLELLSGPEGGFDITVLCEEPQAAYDRVQLSSYFAGKTAQDLALATPQFFEQRGITLKLKEIALSIDRDLRVVTCRSGERYSYDHLILATGSFPFVPAIPGKDRCGCFVYRTLEDLDAIKAASSGASCGVVVGGGLLGLEAAKALKDLALMTHVVEFAPRLMAVQIDDAGGRVLRERIAELGVTVHTGKQTLEILDGCDRAHRLRFADGGELETDLVVFSAGIRARDELARQAGLVVGERGGVVIDDSCKTSDPNISAIGECAAWSGKTFGLVAPGYQMAAVAAARLQGRGDMVFSGADLSTKLKLLGVDVASIGDAHALTPGAKCFTVTDEHTRVYKKLVLDADGKRLLGAVLVGDAEQYGTLLQTLQNSLRLPSIPLQLLMPEPAEGSGAPQGLNALPDAAQICSCNNVTKAALCTAIAEGATTVAALKKYTKASASCGGCAPLVARVLKTELKRRGVNLNNHLCEHFPHSRQELFHLVRVGELRSFDHVLERHGRGLGCDVCKPAVASILASCWNAFVLERDKAALQDTNDYSLANIQKNGSYSVVPRIAAGEITPRQLMDIGRIAEKYDLYTKITGGQRIDLFGAQVHELPLIWAELIDAGFESGHAYGKAVRTVKSCVGSTWCRFGVQDSVGLALDIENRYKGLRAPHKLKFAVSGCTRECAEAQSKDVGVIATEKGWNLYVCGNGGMKPRHAELLAQDLDRDTLLKYIDRFLMFYIRTAERLQRTSVWRDSLEGGLDYLKAVVCEDKLKIGAELEADMQRIVGTYQCEWRTTVNDPTALRRFRHFINSDQADTHIVFVSERGQRRPARPEERETGAVLS